jgi:type VI secretion system FHA domain protein
MDTLGSTGTSSLTTMTLRLRVISGQRRKLSGRDTVEFGVGGGTIGRSADNDWVLPDSQRYVSAHHARIYSRDGHYYLEDISTNGVYVNDAAEPLGKQGSDAHRLSDGDVLRLGEYQIGVSLDETAASGSAALLPSRILAVHPLGTAQTDIGAELDLQDLLGTDASSPGEQPPGTAFGPGRAAPAARPLAPAPVEPSPAARARAPSENLDETVARRLASLARAAGRDVAAAAQEGSDWQAFCRGAGLKPEQLSPHAQGLMHLAGRLLRETLVGLKDLERSRGQTRDRFRIESPPPEPDLPVLGQLTVEELLLALCRQHEAHTLDAVRWLRERHDEIKAHEQALAQALRSAFIEFLGRLDPVELEARFQRGRHGKANPAQYWAFFTTFYRNLLDRPADHLPPTFVEAFAAAYQESLRPQTLDMPRSIQPKPARSA